MSDEQTDMELRRKKAYEEGIKFSWCPGVVFKGDDALRILDEMESYVPSVPAEKVGGPLSDEDIALAQRYFDVDIRPKIKKKEEDPFHLESGEEDD